MALHMESYGKLASGTFEPRRADLAMQLAAPVAVAWNDIGRGEHSDRAPEQPLHVYRRWDQRDFEMAYEQKLSLSWDPLTHQFGEVASADATLVTLSGRTGPSSR